LITLFTACGGSGTAEADQHDHGAETAANNGNTVTLTAAQFAAIDGALGHVEQKDLTSTLQASGFLKVPPQNKADVTAIMGGTVREVLVQEGDQVSKGEVLATIADPAIIQLQQDHLGAKAQLAFAEAELERQTALAAEHISAQKTLQQATAEHAALQARVMATAAQLRLVHINPDQLTASTLRTTTEITSPIDGNVARIHVIVGSRVSGDAPLFSVVNNNQLHVDLFLYEQDIAKVKTGQQIDLSLTNLPGKNYTAVVFAIGSAFESETKTIPVHAEITGNKQGLIDGMGVSARLSIGKALTTAVRTEAIVNMEGKDYVFMKTEGSDAHGHSEAEAHDHAAETAPVHDHAHGQEHDHAHGPDAAHEHAQEAAAQTGTGSLSFQRFEVKRGTTDGAYTAVTFLQPVADHAHVATGGAYYLLAMMNTSSGHQH